LIGLALSQQSRHPVHGRRPQRLSDHRPRGSSNETRHEFSRKDYALISHPARTLREIRISSTLAAADGRSMVKPPKLA